MTTPDLTRWNRAGLSRVAYLGDNAATFVDRLRAAMVEHLNWTEMAPDLAGATLETEDPVARVERLLAQYAGHEPHEIGEELIRAFARASHVLAGHIDAYANEAWLRTATQWSTLRRLTASVGYQPQPPASASMLVALIVAGDAAAIDVAAGLAMQGTPVGGAPAIFETLDPVATHPALNAARTAGWDHDRRLLGAGTLRWDLPAGTDPGLLGVLDYGGGLSAHVLSVPGRDAAGVEIVPDPAWPGAPRDEALLHLKPARIQRGRPISANSRYVMVTNAVGVTPGALIEGIYTDIDGYFIARVEDHPYADIYMLEGALGDASHPFDLVTLTPFTASGFGWTETSPDVTWVWWWDNNAVHYARKETGAETVIADDDYGTKTGVRKNNGHIVARRFNTGSAEKVWARVHPVTQAARIIMHQGDAVAFDGKPDPRTIAGAVFMGVTETDRVPLRVRTVTIRSDGYDVLFDRGAPALPDEVDFHGPMTLVARPAGHDRSDAAVVTGHGFVTEPLPLAAGALVHPGRRLVLRDERDLGSARTATVTAVSTGTAAAGMAPLQLSFAEEDSDFAQLKAGWTVLHANTVMAGHGEQKGALVLGSGDAEREHQAFPVAVRDMAFAAHPGAEAGVAPVLRFTVDGVAWDYADLVEPSAEGKDAWSYALEDDGTLTLLPRRRLPTGTDNVVIVEHRRGQGPAANNVAPGSVVKPMRRHARVEAIVQPFASAGGATREPVAAMRANAAARLAANGRAVTVADYARLVRRHASVWDARAIEGRVGGRNGIEVVIWPAGGSDSIIGVGASMRLADSLAADLDAFIRARERPGVPFLLRPARYNPAGINATVRVDAARYDPRTIEAAVRAALFAAFGMQVRTIGQDLHIGEVIGVIERVPGVRTSTVTIGATVPDRIERYSDGTVRAIRAATDEVVALPSEASGAVTAEAAHD